jgi:hypothetical protein
MSSKYSFEYRDKELFITFKDEGVDYKCAVSDEDVINITKNNIQTTKDLERAFKCAVEKTHEWSMVITERTIYKLIHKSFFVNIEFTLEFIDLISENQQLKHKNKELVSENQQLKLTLENCIKTNQELVSENQLLKQNEIIHAGYVGMFGKWGIEPIELYTKTRINRIELYCLRYNINGIEYKMTINGKSYTSCCGSFGIRMGQPPFNENSSKIIVDEFVIANFGGFITEKLLIHIDILLGFKGIIKKLYYKNAPSHTTREKFFNTLEKRAEEVYF